MRKLISLVLAVGLVLVGTIPAWAAFTSLEKETVSASVTVTGTPFVDVDPKTLTWPVITLGVDNWVPANEAVKITYLLPASGGVQIYTQNSSGKAGLQGVTNPATVLPTCWRVTDDAATAAQKTIYEKVVNESDVETTTGLENINGVAGIQAGVIYDANGDGDTKDYLGILSDKADAYLSWDPTQPDPKKLGRYACHIWMKDKAGLPAAGYEDYATIVKSSGIQHAEFSWGDWANSPVYLSIGANFGKATPQDYSANLTIELYSL